jgi:hypothetical protein
MNRKRDMREGTGEYNSRERVIARLLRCGTWLASGTVAAGLTVELLHHLDASILRGLNGFDLMKAGVALFILLPVTRVALMLGIFLREQDHLYAAISALVLAIIGASFLAGLWTMAGIAA